MSKKILFCLTGSISCYKACEVISMLKKNKFEIQCVATNSALNFIGEATLEGLTGLPVLTNSFISGKMMIHIDAARTADLILICPATAKTINHLANGTHPELLGDIYLANNFKKPVLIAPSMNSEMLQHPATQQSLNTLKNHGAKILKTDHGLLACGEVGYGRLLEPEIIYAEILSSLNSSKLQDYQI